jgi:hypothetical protein
VDVNSDNVETLLLLLHIDTDRAAQIQALRPFDSTEDLDRVDGLRAGGPRLAELVAGDDTHPPLCDIDQAGSGDGNDADKTNLPQTGSPALVLFGIGLGLATFGGLGMALGRRAPQVQ